MKHSNPSPAPSALNIRLSPEGVYLIDTFTVPEGSRPQFEAAMRRNREFIRGLPGFRGDAVLVRQQGNATFDIATIAAWESPAAIAAAKEQVDALYARIGFDMRAAIASWGVTLERAICGAPASLQ